MYFGDIYTLAYTHKEMNANIHVKNKKYAGCGPFLFTCAIFKKARMRGTKKLPVCSFCNSGAEEGKQMMSCFFFDLNFGFVFCRYLISRPMNSVLCVVRRGTEECLFIYCRTTCQCVITGSQ